MTWILLAVSLGAYNQGTVSYVEFNSQRACIVAREQIKEFTSNVGTACVPKGAVNEQAPAP